MGMNGKTINIDPERFAEAFKKRNLTFSETSVFCGFGNTYFTQCKNRGVIGKPAAKMLEQLYHMDKNEYAITPDPIKETPESLPPVDYDALETVIFKAVYEAVKKAWAE